MLDDARLALRDVKLVASEKKFESGTLKFIYTEKESHFSSFFY